VVKRVVMYSGRRI